MKVDKRTKAYKASQKKLQQAIDNKDAFVDKGLGDKVEEFTTKTGIKKVVKAIFGDDCGCNERKAKLNKINLRFPVVRCFTEQQYNDWQTFRAYKGEALNIEQQMLIINVYNHLFARTLKKQSCCYESYINDINRVFDKYQ